jgi:thymidylate synthase (FAD)
VWTASLEAIANFIRLRDHEHTQKEIRDYAVAMKDLTERLFPNALGALLGGENE